MNRKPSWDDAPLWATHLCMNADGVWVWFSAEPVYDDGTSSWITRSIYDISSIADFAARNSMETKPFTDYL